MIKDLIEDLKRHNEDSKENNNLCECFNEEKCKFQLKKWANIMLGDIIKIN